MKKVMFTLGIVIVAASVLIVMSIIIGVFIYIIFNHLFSGLIHSSRISPEVSLVYGAIGTIILLGWAIRSMTRHNKDDQLDLNDD